MRLRWIPCLMLLPAVVIADDPGASRGAAAYLSLTPGARAMAMGSAQVAVPAEDAAAFQANPAQMPGLRQHCLSATSGAIGLDRSYYFAAYSFPLTWRQRHKDPFENDPDLQEMRRWNKNRVDSRHAQDSKKTEKESGTADDLSIDEFNRDTSGSFGEASESRKSRWFLPIEGIPMSITAGMTMFGIDNIDGRSEFGAKEADFQDIERTVALSFGIQPYKNLSLGFTGKYLSQSLQSASASGHGFDVGMTYGIPWSFHGDWAVGLAARDLGSKLSWEVDDSAVDQVFKYDEPVRSKMVLGVSHTSPQKKWVSAIEAFKTAQQSARARVGLEWRHWNIFPLRAGFSGSDPTFGFGVRCPFGQNTLSLDYSFEYDLQGLVNPHWLTLSIQFLPVKSQ